MRVPRLGKRWFVPAPPPSELIEQPTLSGSEVCYELDRGASDFADCPRLLVTALGHDNPKISETINATCSIALTDGLFPVVVGTGLDTVFLVNAPMPVETLPRHVDLACLSKPEYRQYVMERWKIILGKWAVTETIDLAQDFDGFVIDQLDDNDG